MSARNDGEKGRMHLFCLPAKSSDVALAKTISVHD